MEGRDILPDWGDAPAYDVMAGMGHYAIAWEVLRRNPDYQRLAAVGANDREVVPMRDDIHFWGLHFP
jgi:hypothetical protein